MYLLITFFRNLLYDLGILRSYRFDFPIITVGNITVGGTGKTPHIEYFVRRYSAEGKRVAVVSRGYRRKTKGMVVADSRSTADSIGDEPYQIFRKFPHIMLVADSDRVRAVKYLMAQEVKPDIILLDDGFQYRRLAAGRQVVLVDYGRPIFEDRILPYGRLRECRCGIRRADEVIVSKCPSDISEAAKQQWAQRLGLPERIELRFSTLDFLPPRNIFSGEPLDMDGKHDLHVITGVVRADSLYDYLRPFAASMERTAFADHHRFSASDIEFINRLANRGTTIIVTEKDASKLVAASTLSPAARRQLYSVEVRVRFLQ